MLKCPSRSRYRYPHPYRLLLLALPLLLLLMGSDGLYAQKKARKKKQTKLMRDAGQEIEISAYELNLQMHEFYLWFSGTVEANADSIMALADDPQIDKNALQWKMYAIPAAQKAILVQDPLAALVDATALCVQQTNFFRNGAGADLFGPWQSVALQTALKLEEGTREIAAGLSENRDFSAAEADIRRFAARNPIPNLYFERASTLDLMGKVMASERIGLGKTIANVNAAIDELGIRLNFYIDQVPKQVRWQAQFMIYETLEQANLPAEVDSLTTLATHKVDSLVALAEAKGDSLFGYLDRLTVLAESSPDLVDQQRSALLRDLGRERAILLAALRQERLETLELLIEERAIILDRISEERRATLEHLERITQESIAYSFQESERIIDKLFWRSLLLLALVGAIALGALWIVWGRPNGTG